MLFTYISHDSFMYPAAKSSILARDRVECCAQGFPVGDTDRVECCAQGSPVGDRDRAECCVQGVPETDWRVVYKGFQKQIGVLCTRGPNSPASTQLIWNGN